MLSRLKAESVVRNVASPDEQLDANYRERFINRFKEVFERSPNLRFFCLYFGFSCFISFGGCLFYAIEHSAEAPFSPEPRLKGVSLTCLGNHNFWGSLFYAFSAASTIGFGQLHVCTNASRVLTLCYCVTGIPFLVYVLSDLGERICRGLVFGYSLCLKRWAAILRQRERWRRRRKKKDDPKPRPISFGSDIPYIDGRNSSLRDSISTLYDPIRYSKPTIIISSDNQLNGTAHNHSLTNSSNQKHWKDSGDKNNNNDNTNNVNGKTNDITHLNVGPLNDNFHYNCHSVPPPAYDELSPNLSSRQNGFPVKPEHLHIPEVHVSTTPKSSHQGADTKCMEDIVCGSLGDSPTRDTKETPGDTGFDLTEILSIDGDPIDITDLELLAPKKLVAKAKYNSSEAADNADFTNEGKDFNQEVDIEEGEEFEIIEEQEDEEEPEMPDLPIWVCVLLVIFIIALVSLHMNVFDWHPPAYSLYYTLLFFIMQEYEARQFANTILSFSLLICALAIISTVINIVLYNIENMTNRVQKQLATEIRKRKAELKAQGLDDDVDAEEILNELLAKEGGMLGKRALPKSTFRQMEKMAETTVEQIIEEEHHQQEMAEIAEGEGKRQHVATEELSVQACCGTDTIGTETLVVDYLDTGCQVKLKEPIDQAEAECQPETEWLREHLKSVAVGTDDRTHIRFVSTGIQTNMPRVVISQDAGEWLGVLRRATTYSELYESFEQLVQCVADRFAAEEAKKAEFKASLVHVGCGPELQVCDASVQSDNPRLTDAGHQTGSSNSALTESESQAKPRNRTVCIQFPSSSRVQQAPKYVPVSKAITEPVESVVAKPSKIPLGPSEDRFAKLTLAAMRRAVARRKEASPAGSAATPGTSTGGKTPVGKVSTATGLPKRKYGQTKLPSKQASKPPAPLRLRVLTELDEEGSVASFYGEEMSSASTSKRGSLGSEEDTGFEVKEAEPD